MAEFVNGLIVKKPHQNAPDFIIAKLSFKIEDFTETMELHGDKGWFNVEVKESKKGSYYAEVDTWKPNTNQEPQTPAEDVSQENDDDSELPF